MRVALEGGLVGTFPEVGNRPHHNVADPLVVEQSLGPGQPDIVDVHTDRSTRGGGIQRSASATAWPTVWVSRALWVVASSVLDEHPPTTNSRSGRQGAEMLAQPSAAG